VLSALCNFARLARAQFDAQSKGLFIELATADGPGVA
jgi:hypothetical protein